LTFVTFVAGLMV